MIASTFLLSVLLVVGQVSADQPQGEVSNVQPVPVVPFGQPQHIAEHGVVVENAPAQQVVGPVVEHQAVQHSSQQPPQHPQQPQYHYSPSGLVQVVGGEQQQQQQHQQHAQPQFVGSKPVVQQHQQSVGHYSAAAPSVVPQAEQYGQPESASIPPNYKPWGSWGLYIGGNPADGYYSSYYKALSQSVADKQEVNKPGSHVVSQASGLSAGSSQSPLLKQGSFPYTYQDSGYPYDSIYTPTDLNSGSRLSIMPQPGAYPTQYAPVVYGNSYAPEMYGTKRMGQASPVGTKSQVEEVVREVAQAPVKGQPREQPQPKGYLSYASGSPLAYQQQQQQVVAYPVPVGSQIVGSQPGVEGAYAPFGVHGYTRYAIKPTVVSSSVAEPQPQYHHGVHSSPVSQFPAYKQAYGYYQPLSFYGYPLNQLHYSQDSLSPSTPQVESSAPPRCHPRACPWPLGMPAAGVQYEAAASSTNKDEIKPKESSSASGLHYSQGSLSPSTSNVDSPPCMPPGWACKPRAYDMPAGVQLEAAASSTNEDEIKPKESSSASSSAVNQLHYSQDSLSPSPSTPHVESSAPPRCHPRACPQ